MRDVAKQRAAQRAFFHRRKDRIAVLKHRPCMDCGQWFPPECMDFDHRGDKSFEISNAWNRRFERVLEEIRKCDVVCANCHRIRTRKRHTIYPHGVTE